MESKSGKTGGRGEESAGVGIKTRGQIRFCPRDFYGNKNRLT